MAAWDDSHAAGGVAEALPTDLAALTDENFERAFVGE